MLRTRLTCRRCRRHAARHGALRRLRISDAALPAICRHTPPAATSAAYFEPLRAAHFAATP